MTEDAIPVGAAAASRRATAGLRVTMAVVSMAAVACGGDTTGPGRADLVELGRRLFFEETFDGNGRTCGTCHPADGGFALDSAVVAARPPDDPLFVFERDPSLADLEDGRLLRERALVLANADGFDRPHVFRSAPSLVNVAFTAPYGWSGEFRTLQAFARGAVEQHFPRTLARRPGVDFREPTERELDALAAFMSSLTSGHGQAMISSPTRENLAPLLETEEERLGMDIFFGAGRCSTCHSGPALAFPDPNGPFGGREPFFDNRGKGAEGKNVLPVNREDGLPPDDGDGEGRFNTANVLGLRSGQRAFFHDNGVPGSLRDEVEAYTGEFFATSPAGRQLGGIDLTVAEIDAVTAFLRAINDVDPGDR